MNKKRLLKLADFLETVPPKKFNLRFWQAEKPTKPEASTEGSCGFAGCAIGWAAHAKLFRGLKLVDDFGDMTPLYNGSDSWRAVGELFSITHGGHWCPGGEAEDLFMSNSYETPPTPKQVAKRIRKFVETGEIA